MYRLGNRLEAPRRPDGCRAESADPVVESCFATATDAVTPGIVRSRWDAALRVVDWSSAECASATFPCSNIGPVGAARVADVKDMPWRRAITRVLSEAREPLHYSEIAQRILDNGLRQHGGATPAATVASTISMYMQDDLVRVDRGVYGLASSPSKVERTPIDEVRAVPEAQVSAAEDTAQENGFLNALGMFWRREEVDWEQRGQTLLGAQLKAAQPINFASQVGVYILYSGDRVIYVGRITEPRLGPRLWDHTRDRLTGRWDRFSWFGVRAVADDGSLGPVPAGNFAVDMLVATMEALLIEGLEPPQNRRRGDGFNATEFIQTADPQVEHRRAQHYLSRLSLAATQDARHT